MCVNRHAFHCYYIVYILPWKSKKNKTKYKIFILPRRKRHKGIIFTHPPTHLKRHFDVLRGNLTSAPYFMVGECVRFYSRVVKDR